MDRTGNEVAVKMIPGSDIHHDQPLVIQVPVQPLGCGDELGVGVGRFFGYR